MIYLLLSFSTANASFWCLDEESYSHLESSPIGKCWINCLSDTDANQQAIENTQSTLFSAEQEEDCLDSPVYSSALTSSDRTSTPNKILAINLDFFNSLRIPSLGIKNQRFTNLSLSTHLPAPQAIKTLRTVVLLH
ncbi:MAG TPA: hypothetical protein VKN62_04655 [Pelovirga sp.]|nr:hypothetical protein [Pelovirga sp.]